MHTLKPVTQRMGEGSPSPDALPAYADLHALAHMRQACTVLVCVCPIPHNCYACPAPTGNGVHFLSSDGDACELYRTVSVTPCKAGTGLDQVSHGHALLRRGTRVHCQAEACCRNPKFEEKDSMLARSSAPHCPNSAPHLAPCSQRKT